MIADIAHWDGDPDALVEALVRSKILYPSARYGYIVGGLYVDLER
jgi:hypothetical protein